MNGTLNHLFTDNGGETGRRVHFTQNWQNRWYALTIRCDTLPKQLLITIDKCEFKHKNLELISGSYCPLQLLSVCGVFKLNAWRYGMFYVTLNTNPKILHNWYLIINCPIIWVGQCSGFTGVIIPLFYLHLTGPRTRYVLKIELQATTSSTSSTSSPRSSSSHRSRKRHFSDLEVSSCFPILLLFLFHVFI